MRKKSKILKLVNKQKHLKFWCKWGGYIFALNALISGLLIPINALNDATIFSTIFVSTYMLASIGLLGYYEINGKDIILNNKNKVDQEILQLVKENDAERIVLREYHELEKIEQEINEKKKEKQEQRQLIKTMIAENNKKAAEQKSYIKALTKAKKKNAKDEAIKEAMINFVEDDETKEETSLFDASM